MKWLPEATKTEAVQPRLLPLIYLTNLVADKVKAHRLSNRLTVCLTFINA